MTTYIQRKYWDAVKEQAEEQLSYMRQRRNELDQRRYDLDEQIKRLEQLVKVLAVQVESYAPLETIPSGSEGTRG